MTATTVAFPSPVTLYFVVVPPDGPAFVVRTTRRTFQAAERIVREQFPESRAWRVPLVTV